MTPKEKRALVRLIIASVYHLTAHITLGETRGQSNHAASKTMAEDARRHFEQAVNHITDLLGE